MLRLTIFINVSLHASSAWDIIFRRRQFQHTAIGQGARLLHKPFTIRALADDNGAVIILQGAGRDFRSRSRRVIGQDDDGHLRIQGFGTRLIGYVVFFYLSFYVDHFLAARDKKRHDLGGLIHESAGVIAQVEQQALSALLLQLGHGLLHIAPRIFRILIEQNISDTVLQDLRRCNAGQHDVAARYFERQWFAHAVAFHFQGKACARLAAQRSAHAVAIRLLAFRVCGRIAIVFSVLLQENISGAQSGFSSRLSGIRTIDDAAMKVAAKTNNRANAGIFARSHLLQILRFALRIVLRVGVKPVQHIVYRAPHHLGRVQRVDVIKIEQLIQHIKRLQLLSYFCVVCLCVQTPCREQGREQNNSNLSHNSLHISGNRPSGVYLRPDSVPRFFRQMRTGHFYYIGCEDRSFVNALG